MLCCFAGGCAVVGGADAPSAATGDERWNNVDNAEKVDGLGSDEGCSL